MNSKKICKSISIIPIHDFNLPNLLENNLNETFWEFNEFGDEERDKNIDGNNAIETESIPVSPIVKKRNRGRPRKKKNISIDNNNNTIINRNLNKNKKTYSKKKGKLIQKKLNVFKESKNDSNPIDEINKKVTKSLSKSISNVEDNDLSKNEDELSKNDDEISKNEIQLSTNKAELSIDNNDVEMSNLNFNSDFNLNINDVTKIQVCASSINVEEDINYHEKQVSKLVLPSSLSYNLEIDDNEITKVDNDNLAITNNSDLDKLDTFFREYKLKMLKIEEKITEKFQMEIRNHRHIVAKQVAELINVFKSQSVAGAERGGQ